MERIVFFAISVLILCGCITTKCNFSNNRDDNYRTFLSFEGDTIAYTLYNFEENKEKYIGEKFIKLYNDIEVPIVSYIPDRLYRKPDYADGVILNYCTMDKSMGNSILGKPFCKVTIKFKNEFLAQDLKKLQTHEIKTIWNKKHVQFLKDFVVSDIIVYVDNYERMSDE